MQLLSLSDPTRHQTHSKQLLRVGQRLLRCMARYFAAEGRLAAAGNASLLGRAMRQRLWEDSPQQCRQLPNGELAWYGEAVLDEAGASVHSMKRASWSASQRTCN